MNINAPFGGGCIGKDPLCFSVTDCEDFDSISWTFPYKPNGAPDPTIVHLGDGQFEISAAVSGSYLIQGECCD